MENNCSLLDATLCLIPVTEKPQLRIAIGHEHGPWFYGFSFMTPFMAKTMNIYADKGNVSVRNKDVGFFFLDDAMYRRALERDHNELEQCYEMYLTRFVHTLSKKERTMNWVYGPVPVLEYFAQDFMRSGVKTYFHELRIPESRQFAIFLQSEHAYDYERALPAVPQLHEDFIRHFYGNNRAV